MRDRGRCSECNKYGHKSTDPKYPEIKKENEMKKMANVTVVESCSQNKLL